MIAEKTDLIIKAMGFDIVRIADAAGFDRSIVSRIRNGARIPKKNSSSIEKFARGVIICAEREGKTDLLCRTIGCSTALLPDEIKSALLDWLFDENDATDVMQQPVSGSDGRAFGSKLSRLMELADINNATLSKAVDIDPSYLSRMRKGERILGADSTVLSNICNTLADLIARKERPEDLAEVLEVLPEIAAKADSDMLRQWLTDEGVLTDTAPVRKLIGSIENISSGPEFSIPDVDYFDFSVMADTSDEIYRGMEGLRMAAVRFLFDAVKNAEGELLLYSDQSMEWMSGDFYNKWLTLMGGILRRGVNIKVIHTIERSSAEMITAIADWLPLYMSGLIDPYYCTRRLGDRFCFSMFIDPGRACIKGACVRGYEKLCDYRYITDKHEVALRRQEFDGLLADCRPLIRISRVPVPPKPDTPQKTIGSVQMFIENGVVRINKLTQPGISFRFDHPLLIEAFRSFI